MNSSNEETLRSYQENFSKYLDRTPQAVNGEWMLWLDEVCSEIKIGDDVLEIGSAFGRDAAYIENKGFSVQRTDAFKGAIEYLKSKGYDAQTLDILQDDINGEYDLIFANAVFLHFTPEEFATILSKIHSALKFDGVLAFTLKIGEGSEWSDEKIDAPRFFQYWQPGDIAKLLVNNGFTSNNIRTDDKWIQVISKRSE